MTEKLFYKDAYLKECRSKIVRILEEDDKIKVVLDKTIFYPEGGGQPSDTGTIDGLKVNYVYEDNGVIYHCIEGKPKNKCVTCKIDFKKRFDYMQQHSGEHLLSGVIFTLFNGNNRGFHLGEDHVTVDIDIEPMDENMINRIENLVNECIYKNRTIKTYVVSRKESLKFPLRKQVKEGVENVRIVQALNMDCCACCGTHVLRTGEIGILKILKAEKYKKMTRIYFKCGNRALADFQKEHKIIMDLSKDFSTEIFHIEDRVNFEKNEIKEAFKVFEEAINLDENYAETYIVKAEAHIGMYEMEEACQCIKKYLTFVPKSKRAYLDLIEIYDATAEFEKAIFYCNELLKEDNKNAELYFKKADFYDMLGENEEALNCCDDCLKLKPDYYDALCLKGSLLNALDRNTESLEAYSKAIEVDKTNSKAYLEKALVYKDMDNYHTALEYAKKAYELALAAIDAYDKGYSYTWHNKWREIYGTKFPI